MKPYALLLILFLSGCQGPRYPDYLPYYEDGYKKPQVVLFPFLDRRARDLARRVEQVIQRQF